ncbi:MAG: hypothetical protein AB7O39_06415 [Flavobacteriaceae bacterium]
MRNRLARLPLALAVVIPLAIGGAVAAEAPKPKKDFAGDMVVSGKGQELVISMRYSTTLDKMRTDVKAQGMEMMGVRDMKSGEIIMWSNQMPNMAMRIHGPTDEEIDAQKTGETREIDGVACAVWKVKEATACLTDDNIMLESQAEGMTARMTNLEIAAQDENHFAPPSGVNVMDVPKNMQGLPDFKQGLPF